MNTNDFFRYIAYCSCALGLWVLSGCGDGRFSSPDNNTADEKIFPVEVTRAAYEEVSHTLEAVGSFLPEEEVTVSAEVAGTIKRLAIDEGSAVVKGQDLLTIDDEQVRLQVEETEAQLKETQERLKNSQSNLRRLTSLFKDGVIGQQDLDDAQTQVSLDLAAVEKLNAQLNQARRSLKDTLILAPIDGVISARLVSVGEYVKVGAELVKIVDANPLKLVFSLPEKNAGQIRTGQQVTVKTNVYPGETFQGSIYFINPKVDRDTRSLEVKAWVDNSDGKLKPGFFVDVTQFLKRTQSLTLPESAVLVREGTIVVMAVEKRRITYKKVVPGIRFGGKVEILEGISTQDQIVVYGRSEISEGTLVKPVPTT